MFFHFFEYSKFIDSNNVVGTSIFLGGTRSIAFSKPAVHPLSSTLQKAGTPSFFASRIYLLVTGFAPAKLVLRILRNRNWCTGYMLTTTTGRGFSPDPKQSVSSFSLSKPSSPCCFAAPLNNVFPSIRFP